MRRPLILSAIGLALWIAAIWASGGMAAVGTQPVGSVRIQDGFHTQLLRIDHNGAATVTCMTAAGVAESCGGSGGGGDAVNVFHQSTIRHVSSVLHARLMPSDNANDIVAMHIVGPMNRGLGAIVAHGGGLQTVLSNAAGTLVTVTGTSLDVNCTGCSAASVVNVAHISAQVHARLIPSSNVNDIIAVHGGMAQSGTWTIQATHQGGQWNIAHVTSVVHVAGVVHLQSNLVDSTNNALRVTGVTVFTIMGAVDHISSRVHAVLIPSSNANDQIKVHGAMAQSGTWFIQAAHQGGNWTIAHQSTQVHVVLTGPATKPGSGHLLAEVTGPHATGSIHVSSISNIGSGAPGTGTTAIACHSTLAVHVAAAAPGYTQLIHLTSSNNGINQSAWRIYICGIVLVSAHAQSIALLEGTGTTCATLRQAVIGSWRVDDSVPLAANGGFAAVAPFPWLSTQGSGNNLCIAQSSRTTGTVSGVITYRAGP